MSIEDKIGVAPLEVLQDQRRKHIAQAKDLRARYGDQRIFDAWRKTQLASLAMKVRAIAAEKGTKVTEAFIEEQAHAAPEYLDIMTEALRDRARLQELENQIQDINEQITRDNILIAYSRAELGL